MGKWWCGWCEGVGARDGAAVEAGWEGWGVGGVVRAKGRRGAHLPLFKNMFSTCCARAYVHVGRGECDACGLVFRFPRGAVDFSWLIWCLVMVTNGREHFPANIQQGFLVFKGMACLATQLCFLIVRRAGGADNCVFSTIWYLASWTELLCVAVATYVIHCVVSPSRGDHCTWREFGAWFVALLAPTCATFAPTGRGGRSRIARVPFGSGVCHQSCSSGFQSSRSPTMSSQAGTVPPSCGAASRCKQQPHAQPRGSRNCVLHAGFCGSRAAMMRTTENRPLRKWIATLSLVGRAKSLTNGVRLSRRSGMEPSIPCRARAIVA